MLKLALATHVVYLVTSVLLTVWVARTLSRNGLAFLRDSFAGNDELARSINHLLVVGFYLLNLGYVTLAIRREGYPHNLVDAIEILSVRLGWVLLILGALHLLNMYLFTRWRRHSLEERERDAFYERQKRAEHAELGL